MNNVSAGVMWFWFTLVILLVVLPVATNPDIADAVRRTASAISVCGGTS